MPSLATNLTDQPFPFPVIDENIVLYLLYIILVCIERRLEIIDVFLFYITSIDGDYGIS